MALNPEETAARFQAFLENQLQGLADKVTADFSVENYEQELAALKSDSVYSSLGFAIPAYVLVRLMGRISISIGRRLGELYDKIPRLVAAARFELEPEVLAPKLGDLIIDIGLDYELLKAEEVAEAKVSATKHLGTDGTETGLGIEVRYNFNPNDSSRLRKDEAMAGHILDKGWTPVYLVFCSISPRDEAIARLKRAGWHFRIGADASAFARDLLGLDLETILSGTELVDAASTKVQEIMQGLLDSEAFALGSTRGEELSA